MLKKILSSPAQGVGITLLLLSPVAYFFGVWLVFKTDSAASSGLKIDRQQAISIAAEVATSNGVNLANWSSICWVKSENDLHYYQQLPVNAERELARKALPASILAVLFRSPDRGENFQVEIAFD
ncbi:MAG: hypothetical protein AAB401_08935, partial [Acidobacteriota bacterium]